MPDDLALDAEHPLEQKERSTKKDVSKDILELVEAGVAMGLGEREVLLYYYISFIKLMSNRLLNDNKPVDLGFVLLHATLYGWNWKQKMRKGNQSKKSHREYLGTSYKNPEFYTKHECDTINRMRLLNLDLLAMNSMDRYLYRRVEVEHTWRWWDMVKSVEGGRLKALGPIRYANLVVSSLIESAESTLRIFHKWNTAISRRTGLGAKKLDEGHFHLLPAKSFKGAETRRQLPPLHPDQFKRLHKIVDQPEDIPDAAAEMPAMPTVQPLYADVRDDRKPIPQSSYPPAGKSGLLVLPSDESPVRGVGMLAGGGDGRTTG